MCEISNEILTKSENRDIAETLLELCPSNLLQGNQQELEKVMKYCWISLTLEVKVLEILVMMLIFVIRRDFSHASNIQSSHFRTVNVFFHLKGLPIKV